MTYAICYDLNTPGQDYTKLWQAIKKHGTWWHHLDSTWFINTSSNATQIRDDLMKFIDANDELLVFPVGEDWAGFGFNEKSYNWLKNNWN